MRSAKILQRVHGEMYNRPILYQNALLSFGCNIKLRKVSVHWRKKKSFTKSFLGGSWNV